MFIICLKADLCFHCFISQQAPRGGPGLPAGNQVEEKAKQPLERNDQVLWALLSPQGSAPLLSSPPSPSASPYPHPLLTGPALPGWVEGIMFPHLRCVFGPFWMRTHWIPFLKKALHSLSRIWWSSFQLGSLSNSLFPHVTHLPRNYFGDLAYLSFLLKKKKQTKHDPPRLPRSYTRRYTLSVLLLQTVFVRKNSTLTWRPTNTENCLKTKAVR